MTISDFKKISTEIRKKIICMHAKVNTAHIGSSFSCVDILTVLYFSILKIFPENPRHPFRDRLLFSKGHGASALYTTLAFRKLIPLEWLEGYLTPGGKLAGHPDRLAVPFVEISTGSLGHGLPIGLGMAYALSLSNNPARTFVIMSDGEIQEGSVWEAANNSSRLKLSNLIAVIDTNKLQSFDRTNDIMSIASFKSKWEAFGWNVQEVDGHDHEALQQVFHKITSDKNKNPSVVIAHTVKGKGITEFEDKLGWHYWAPKPEHIEKYLSELDEKSIC